VIQRALAVHLDQLHLRPGTGHRDVDAVVHGAAPVGEVPDRVRGEVVADPRSQAERRAPGLQSLLQSGTTMPIWTMRLSDSKGSI
jgi:hypothetical protein